MILNLISFLILVVHILSVKNPSDATLASLSISIYPRWCPRWRSIISEKNCVIWKYVSNLFTPSIVSYEDGILLKTLGLHKNIKIK